MKRLALAAAFAAFSSASIADLAVPRDGWASWEVRAMEGAQNWCCIEWKRKPASHVACELDRTDGGYGTTGRGDTTSTMRVYARFADGKLEKVRALGPSCEVSTNTPIRDLGTAASTESARWLAAQMTRSDKRLVDDLLAAISTHHGAAPQLIALARTDPDRKVRSQAWFWLSQNRAPETEGAIASALRQESDRHVRHQAIFALSQLPAERAVKALGDVIGDKALSRDDRKQGLFWMGQVDSPLATAYIDRILGGK